MSGGKAGTRSPVEESRAAAQSVPQASLIQQLRNRSGLDIATLAECLGYSTTTVAAWESGKKVPGQLAQKRIGVLTEMLTSLNRVVSRKRLPEWIQKPLPGLGNRAVTEFLKEQRYEPLYRMVHLVESGEPG